MYSSVIPFHCYLLSPISCFSRWRLSKTTHLLFPSLILFFSHSHSPPINTRRATWINETSQVYFLRSFFSPSKTFSYFLSAEKKKTNDSLSCSLDWLMMSCFNRKNRRFLFYSLQKLPLSSRHLQTAKATFANKNGYISSNHNVQQKEVVIFSREKRRAVFLFKC